MGAATIVLFENIEADVDKENINMVDRKFFIPIQITSTIEIEYYMSVSDYLNTVLINHSAERINKYTFLVTQSLDIEFEAKVVIDKNDLDNLNQIYIEEEGIENMFINSKLAEDVY